MKSAYIFAVLLFACALASAEVSHKKYSINEEKNITSLKTNFTTNDVENFKIDFYHLNNEESLEKRIQFRQRRGPCNCLNLNCGCCAGMNMQQFNFKRIFCTNLTYDPNEFQVQLDVMQNDDVLYQNMFSAKNPPPMCVPIPYTPAQMCVKLFNIFTPGRNLHMCMDMETKINDKPYLVLHFDCMRMGQDGFTLLKPEDNGGEISEGGAGGGGGGGGGGLFGTGLFSNRPKPTTAAPPPQETVTDVPQIDTDVFDPITEIKLKP